MEFIAAVYPGFGFVCALVLLFLSIGQAWIYKSKGQARALDLALFCFFAALFALNITITHSRLFSNSFTWFYVVGLQPILFFSFYFYMKSLSYFVLIPKWLRDFYYGSQIVLGVCSLVPGIYFLATGVDLYFDSSVPLVTENYFVNSYTTRFGTPRIFPNVLLALSSLINIIATSVLFVRVFRGTRDIYLLFGLVMTVVALAMGHLMLPFAIQFYIPILFIANMAEALRMCFLSSEENEEISKDPKLRDTLEKSHYAFANSSLSDEKISRLSEQLVELMEKQNLFENPNLKLEDISHKMGIPSYQLSQVIRFGLNKNFYDMVNTYRVEKVQKLLGDKQHENKTILDIAFQAGFNSKSSFNLAFKKITGKTPSEYRKKAADLEGAHEQTDP